MEWKQISDNPLVISNYQLLTEIGIFDYIESFKKENMGLEKLLIEAYSIFSKKSVNELLEFIIKCLSDKFIPSNLLFILNEGIMVNEIKTFAFKNMKRIENIEIDLNSLKPYENYFRKHPETTTYLSFKKDMNEPELITPFEKFNPQIIVPVIGISGLYGIILFGPKMLQENYTEKEISYIDKLTKFTSIGIQNNIHYEHSVKDSKTGLYNHNFFIRRVNEELARSKRNKQPFSLIIMDIDKFKDFNDTYGHLAGDEVIISLAKRLKRTLREGDILSRFGGEEFSVLLPEIDSSGAFLAAERIRKIIEALDISYQKEILKVTVSIGISVYNFVESIDENILFKRADEALYESKEDGRNRVTIYKSGLLHRADLVTGELE